MVAERKVGALQKFTVELDVATELLKLATNTLNDFVEGTQIQFAGGVDDIPVAPQRPSLQVQHIDKVIDVSVALERLEPNPVHFPVVQDRCTHSDGQNVSRQDQSSFQRHKTGALSTTSRTDHVIAADRIVDVLVAVPLTIQKAMDVPPLQCADKVANDDVAMRRPVPTSQTVKNC